MAGFGKKLKGYFFDDAPADDIDGVEGEAGSDMSLDEFVKQAPAEERGRGRVVSMSNPVPQSVGSSALGNGMKMVLYKPMCYEDSQNIVDNLRARKPVIVNMVDLDRDCAQRVVDFIAGAVYALDGGIKKVAYGIFVITPNNVSLVGTAGEEEKKDEPANS